MKLTRALASLLTVIILTVSVYTRNQSATHQQTVKPQFQKTVDGFLLTGYQTLFDPIGDGVRTTIHVDIEYQDVSGMKVPQKVRLNGMHGSEPVQAELAFRVKP